MPTRSSPMRSSYRDRSRLFATVVSSMPLTYPASRTEYRHATGRVREALTVPVLGFDHVAITVADVDATVDFYARVLGAEPLLLDRWKSGELPVALLQIGTSRLSVHPASAPAAPHATMPTPGSADLCF